MGESSKRTFLETLERSFLPEEEKRELAESAERGFTPELWNAFNDRLIASIVRTQERQRRCDRKLDDEVDRFTATYEKEKTAIDYAHREALAGAADEAERERLWREYGERIRALQAKLLADVRRTSTTVLHDVILAVMTGV